MNTPAYELISQEYLEDVRATGMLLRHKKSGARVALLSNDDENKVFDIAFRTPPRNSTGVAHIIEHSVLCGSKKYPIKDPFVELAKGSLNTFLNAITYSDKTMYPVASCNDVDFRNLMDVYLDAVFYPNIYSEEKIFLQEGWHYHLENKEDPLTLNGVVYSEMKGAFSSVDGVLGRTVMNTLFPDTPYGVESGGDPRVIPELSYEEFLDFHRRFYHPSNSYICLYGNMDMEERLNWMDEHYLSHFERIEIDSTIPRQKAFDKPRTIEQEYPILDEESETGKTFLAWNAVVSDTTDVTENMAFAILEYVLLDAPGAPVKQALLDAQIGKDISAIFDDEILQPFFSIIARQAEKEDKERFEEVIRAALRKEAEQGIDKKALASGINFFEFRFREADYASYPKGLVYILEMFSSWLYDDENPFAYLRALAVFEDLKKKAEEGYFEALIRTKLLDNPHSSTVILRPRKGLAAEREQRVEKKLAEYKASLSEAEIDAIASATAALKAYQQQEDPKEMLETIPLLRREDIAPEIQVKLSCEETAVDGISCLRHRYATNGIGYLNLLFDTKDVPDAYVPYLGLLRSVLGKVNTEHYGYNELFHEINAGSGGISFSLTAYPEDHAQGNESAKKMLCVRARYLYEQQAFVFSMIREILGTTDPSDTGRLLEILNTSVAGLQNTLPAAGHVTAAGRALSHRSALSAWSDATAGIRFYRTLESAVANYEGRKEELVQILRALMALVFRPENLTVSITADEADEQALGTEIRSLKEMLAEKAENACALPDLTADCPGAQGNEAFKTSGQVQYVALAGTFAEAGLPYTGHLRILKTILSYDYLWNNIRVLGGAYGCMAAMKRSGNSYLVSYRDPKLKETLDVFRALPDYLRALNLDERTMTKYIIGTMSEVDMPMNAAAKGSFALLAHFAHLTDEDFQRERDEILGATPQDIPKLAAYAEALLSTECLCVIGSESAIDAASDLFDSTEAFVQI